MKYILIIAALFYLNGINNSFAQHYGTPAEKKIDEPKQKVKDTNSEYIYVQDSSNIAWLSPGFQIGLDLGLGRKFGLTKYYGISYETYDAYIASEEVELSGKGKAGAYIGLPMQFYLGKSFAWQFYLGYQRDRFQFKQSTASKLNFEYKSYIGGSGFMVDILKNKITIGYLTYLYTPRIRGASFFNQGIEGVGINLEAGYNINKYLRAYIRYDYLRSFAHFFPNDYQAYDEISSYFYSNNFVYASNGFMNAKYAQLNIGVNAFLTTRKPYVKKKRIKNPDYQKYPTYVPSYTPPQQTQPQQPAKDYSKYSEEELKVLLKEANSKSDLTAMLAIQKELDSRAQSNELKNYSYVQLQSMLDKALEAEDYKKAELIKNEMQKRDAEKGMPGSEQPKSEKIQNAPAGDNFDAMSKEELTKLLDEAIKQDDYTKAAKIQEALNKKKD